MRRIMAVLVSGLAIAAVARAGHPPKVAAALKLAGYSKAKILADEPPADGRMAVSVADAFLRKQRQIVAVAPLTMGQPQIVVLDGEIVRSDAKLVVALRGFLTAPDLVEVEVTTSWKLEGGGYSDTMHYLVRRRAAALELVCSFEGNGLLTSGQAALRKRRVMVRPVASEAGDHTVRFDLSYDDVGKDQQGVRQRGVLHYTIAESSTCKSARTPGKVEPVDLGE